MTRLLLAFLSALTVGVQSPAPPLPGAGPASQGLAVATPASQNMTAAKLRAAVDLYRQAVDRDDIRGAVLYVARHGKVVLHEAVGWRHQAYQLPMQKDTLFRMASNTKPVIASAVMMLVEDGKLALTDPVAKYLPAFNNDKSNDITIAQLLSHTSGFRINVIMYPFAKDETPTLQNAVARFGAEGPAAAPGTYSYNNAGFNTLGAVIEVVSGQPLEAFLKSRIYDPLGMSDSLNHEDPKKLARMSTVYTGKKGPDGTVTFTQGFTPGDPPDFPAIRASGGLVSTAADYARFLEMYLEGGSYAGRRVLSADSVNAATTARVRINANSEYGYGWVIAGGTYSHAGSDGTMGWVDPANGIIGMVLTQSPGGNNPVAEFRKLVTEAVTTTPSAPASPQASSLATALAQAETRWAAKKPAVYEFTVDILCFCPLAKTPPTFRVTNGVGAAVTPIEPRVARSYEGFSTIDKLFEMLRETVAGAPYQMSARYHPEFGYPVFADIDHFRDVMDDTIRITVTNFKVIKSQDGR